MSVETKSVIVSSCSFTSKIYFLGFLKSQILISPLSSPVAIVSLFKKYSQLIASSWAFLIWICNFPFESNIPIDLSFETVARTFPSAEKIAYLQEEVWWPKEMTSFTSSELYDNNLTSPVIIAAVKKSYFGWKQTSNMWSFAKYRGGSNTTFSILMYCNFYIFFNLLY